MSSIPDLSTLPPLTRMVVAALDDLARDAAAVADRTPEAERRPYLAAAEKFRRAAYVTVTAGVAWAPAPRGGVYVPSGSRRGITHQVSRAGCSCEAGRRGGAVPCWHVAWYLGLETALEAAALADVEG